MFVLGKIGGRRYPILCQKRLSEDADCDSVGLPLDHKAASSYVYILPNLLDYESRRHALGASGKSRDVAV